MELFEYFYREHFILFMLLICSVYLFIGMFFFGYYNSKYGTDSMDGLITTWSLFFWPIFLVVLILRALFAIPLAIGRAFSPHKRK